MIWPGGFPPGFFLRRSRCSSRGKQIGRQVVDNRVMPGRYLVILLIAAVSPALAQAQNAAQPAPRLTLPTVTVTAQKEPADRQTLPVSVTAVPATTLWDGKISVASEAAIYAPNTWFNEFSARKLSNVFLRGVGSSPGNPGVTTYIDGVPQLNANSSNIEFTGIEQVEFVRGPQSALFGRNALGGVVNLLSERPSLAAWSGNVYVPFGNHDTREFRGGASGPLSDTLALGLSAGHAARDGFTINDLTGNDLDSRSATFGKAQLLWTPAPIWEARIIVSGERARDGDYALNDLGSLRTNPFHVARDFEGHTHRDVFNTTVATRREGSRFTLSTTTGVVRWNTEDETDLDYTPFPAATRRNAEEDLQFTQEVRASSAVAAPIALGSVASLKWQAGAFFFTQNYDQNAVNRLAPFVLSPQLPFAIEQTSPRAELTDRGIGLYAQGTITFNSTFDLTLGARFDHERKEAALETFFAPAIAPASLVEADESFSNMSPQAAIVYRIRPDVMAYGSIASGFKAGGFNPASPAGSEAYEEEHTLNFEGGVKSTWAGGRLIANAAVFVVEWTDLQLNLPNPFVPAQFYIANIGGASSRGVEFEVNARPLPDVDIFSAFGYSHARFNDGTSSSGIDVSGNELPNTPGYTFTLGAQLSRALTAAVTLYGRGEMTAYGSFHYDDLNRAAQEGYSLANFRAGARGARLFAEAWIKNAFDTRYVPVAFPFPGFAPSGFIGEPGRPRTYGVSGGVTF
jgi:iron complex outermembrane receptor protein